MSGPLECFINSTIHSGVARKVKLLLDVFDISYHVTYECNLSTELLKKFECCRRLGGGFVPQVL